LADTMFTGKPAESPVCHVQVSTRFTERSIIIYHYLP